MSILPGSEGGGRVRWLLLGSLALNLFFVGAAGAVAFRYSSPVPLTTVAHIDHTLAGRLRSHRDEPAGRRRRNLARGDHPGCGKNRGGAGRSAAVPRRRAQEPAGGAVRCRRHAHGHGGESHRARKFRSVTPRHDRLGGRQNVGGRPQQARRLAGGARQRTAAALIASRLFKPRCAARWRRSPTARVRQWCRRAPACAAIPERRRQARPWHWRAARRSSSSAPLRRAPCGGNARAAARHRARTARRPRSRCAICAIARPGAGR